MALLPSSRLVPCPACAELLVAASPRCPHCGVSLAEGPGRTCTAALLWTSLSLSGCLITAVYGVPTTSDTVSTSSTSGATETGTTGSTGTTTAPTTSASGGTGTESATGTGGTETGGATEGSGTDGTAGTDGTGGTAGSTTSNPEPLYGAALDPVSRT